MMNSSALKEFAKWTILEGFMYGSYLDGCDIQEKAFELELIYKVKYDPDIHISNVVDAQPGDDWFMLDPWFTDPCRTHPDYMGINLPRAECDPCCQLWKRRKHYKGDGA